MVSSSLIKDLRLIVGQDYCLVTPEDRYVYSRDTFGSHESDIVVLPKNTS